MKFALSLLALLATPAFAQDAALNFNPEKLCQWQQANNSMDPAECTKLENESKASVPELEGKADAATKQACADKVQGYAKDSGFASYTLYANCLKDGPDSI